MVQIEGIAVSADFVKNLKDKRFAVGAKPYYEEFPDFKDPKLTRRKLVVPVVVYQDRAVLDFYPNKMSQKIMANLWGYEMDNWVGKLFEWKVIEQMVSGKSTYVIYVVDKKIDEIYVEEHNSN